MKTILISFVVVQLFFSVFVKAQGSIPYSQRNRLEIKLGEEFHRQALIGGVGYNISLSKKFIFVPQLEVVGSIILSGVLKYQLKIEKIIIAPQIGLGVIPMMLFNIPVGNMGFQLSYSLNKMYDIFLESKIYFFHEKVKSVGSENFRKKSVRDYPPITITIGLKF